MSDTARDQAIAQVASICAMVDALDVDYERLEELRDLKKNAKTVGWNMPGYLPDSEPFTVDDCHSAAEMLAAEMEERANILEFSADLESEDDNGRDDSTELRADVAEMRELREVAAGLRANTYEEFGQTIANMHYWFTAAECLPDESDNAELAELESAAGECESEDDARERIQEDALSVEVRSDWCNPGETMEAAEFRIVLCTCGPHVELIGDLNRGEPTLVRVLYRDWGDSGELFDFDHDKVLRYCGQFYFGD